MPARNNTTHHILIRESVLLREEKRCRQVRPFERHHTGLAIAMLVYNYGNTLQLFSLTAWSLAGRDRVVLKTTHQAHHGTVEELPHLTVLKVLSSNVYRLSGGQKVRADIRLLPSDIGSSLS